MRDRNLFFIIVGNKGSGKTTYIKLLQNSQSLLSEPTEQYHTITVKVRLNSSRKSSLFSIERWRKYILYIIDTPGNFTKRRMWRDAFNLLKVNKKKAFIFVFCFNAHDPISETRNALEEVYNQYLESLDPIDIKKADKKAKNRSLLLILLQNKPTGDKINSKFADLTNTIGAIRNKIPLLTIERIEFNFLKDPRDTVQINEVIERMKRYIYAKK